MTNTHEHLEQAEHSQHGAHDPFDRRVAVTMAIIAALLAALTMLGHRAHNATLQLQAEANLHHTKANIFQTQAADEWGYYQAKNIRRHEYESFIKLAGILALQPGASSEREADVKEWQRQVERYKKELGEHENKARTLEKQCHDQQDEAEESLQKSHLVHQQAGGYDLSELAVELRLVLCSLAVLTKLRWFWYSGIFAAVVGVLIVATVLILGVFHTPSPHEPPNSPSPAGEHPSVRL
jgi:hypothetical protein